MSAEGPKLPSNGPYAEDEPLSLPGPLSQLKLDYSGLWEVRKPDRKTERGELLKYFASKLDVTIPRVARAVWHLKTIDDLYFLKSICDRYEREGNPWAKCFWGSLKVH